MEVHEMNRTDLIAVVAEKADITKKEAEKAVTVVFDTIMEKVADGEEVRIVGFGAFERHERKERIDRSGSANRRSEISVTLYLSSQGYLTVSYDSPRHYSHRKIE